MYNTHNSEQTKRRSLHELIFVRHAVACIAILIAITCTNGLYAQSDNAPVPLSATTGVNAPQEYTVFATPMPENSWGYIIQLNGETVFTSHIRSTNTLNAPDLPTQEEAIAAAWKKVDELKKAVPVKFIQPEPNK